MFTMHPSLPVIAKYNIRPATPGITVKVYPTMIHVHKVLSSYTSFAIEMATHEQAHKAIEHLTKFHASVAARKEHYAATNQHDMMDCNLRSYRVEFTVSFSALPSASELEQLHADLMIAITNLARFPLMIRALSFDRLIYDQKRFLRKAAGMQIVQRTTECEDGTVKKRLSPPTVIRMTVLRSAFGIADKLTTKRLSQLAMEILTGDTDIWSAAWVESMHEKEKLATKERRNQFLALPRTLKCSDCDDREHYEACKELYLRELIRFRWAPGRPTVEPTMVTYLGLNQRSTPYTCPLALLRWAARQWLANDKREDFFWLGNKKTAKKVIITFADNA